MIKIAVITGDHTRPDSEKREGRFAAEDFATHAAMVTALRSSETLELVDVIQDHSNLYQRLASLDVDLVVNFCDTGYCNNIKMEIHIPCILEMLGIPYTGCPPAAIVNCYDKSMVSLVASQMGMPVAEEIFVVAGEALPDNLHFPALIKPNRADGSFGISKDAKVDNRAEAEDYAQWLAKALPDRDYLVQEYLPGPEYGVGVIGNPGADFTIFPTLEVDFSKLPQGLTPILSFESKAEPDSPYWNNISFKQANISTSESSLLASHCQRLFARLDLRDYARFDFRRDKAGVIKLMEINPNPAWANDGKLAYMAEFAGISYVSMLELIVHSAIKTYPT